MPQKVTHISLFFYEKFEFKHLASFFNRFIEKRGLISNNKILRDSCLLRCGVSDNKTGWISLTTQLALYDANQWIYFDSVGTKYWVIKVVGEDFLALNEKGRIIKQAGGRRFLYQYQKFAKGRPCNGKLTDITRLILYI